MRKVLIFIGAVLVMVVLGTIASTQFELGALQDVGAPITLDQRFSVALENIAGMGPNYAGLVLAAFLIGFVVAGLTVKPLPFPRPLIYAAAGAVAIYMLHTLAEQVFFGVPVVSGTRSLAGLLTQAAIGALAGLFYARLTAGQAQPQTPGH